MCIRDRNILSAFLLITVSIASDDKDTICPISGGMINGSVHGLLIPRGSDMLILSDKEWQIIK